MSVCYNKNRKKFFICYDMKLPSGAFKTVSIYNKEWTKERGKKYVLSIEKEEIEKDRKKKKIYLHSGENISIGELFELYQAKVSLKNAIQTAQNKYLKLRKYLINDEVRSMSVDNFFTVATIERFKDRVINAGVGIKTQNNCFAIVRELLSFTAKNEYISNDLAIKLSYLIEGISSKSNSPTESEEANSKNNYLTPEEWDRFYDSYDNQYDPYLVLFETTYKCALRIGETLGLKWSDLNLNTHTIYIHRARIPSGQVTTPKTKSSIAPVSVEKNLLNKLVQFKEQCGATDNDYIFFPWGTVSRTTIREKLIKQCQKSGVRVITVHGLRHSCASRMINQGIKPLLVSRHLRHSSMTETLNTYSHLFSYEANDVIDTVF